MGDLQTAELAKRIEKLERQNLRYRFFGVGAADSPSARS